MMVTLRNYWKRSFSCICDDDCASAVSDYKLLKGDCEVIMKEEKKHGC